MIPFRQRGLYQAMQNILFGFGAVLGASLGGVITEAVGWRWCFLLQVPVSLLALVVGYLVLEDPNPPSTTTTTMPTTSMPTAHPAGPGQRPSTTFRAALRRLDLAGALTLVVGLVAQLLGLSLGGNEFPWSSAVVVGALAGSVVLLLGVFVAIEAATTAMPMIPLRMLRGWQPAAVQLTNVFSGMAAYAVRRIGGGCFCSFAPEDDE